MTPNCSSADPPKSEFPGQLIASSIRASGISKSSPGRLSAVSTAAAPGHHDATEGRRLPLHMQSGRFTQSGKQQLGSCAQTAPDLGSSVSAPGLLQAAARKPIPPGLDELLVEPTLAETPVELSSPTPPAPCTSCSGHLQLVASLLSIGPVHMSGRALFISATAGTSSAADGPCCPVCYKPRNLSSNSWPNWWQREGCTLSW